MDKTEWLVQRLTDIPMEPFFRREGLGFLFGMKELKELKYHAYAFNVDESVPNNI